MKDTNRIANELFDKIQSRFEDVTLGDENAKSVDDPELARFFNFDYIDSDGENFGNITISLVDSERLKLYFGRKFGSDMDSQQKQRWYKFLKGMRKFSKQNLLKFDPRDISRSKLRYKDVKAISRVDSPIDSRDTTLGESLMPMTHKLSYQDLGPIRLVIKHIRPINDENPGSRSRSIDSIFFQNNDGERFRSPYRSLSVSRALANHLVNGGKVNDASYSKICEYVDDLKKLAGFLRRARRENYQDSEILGLVQEAHHEYQSGRNLIKQLAGPRTYQHSINELMERFADEVGDQDQDYLKNKFSRQVIDQRIESALPTISKLYHQRQKNKKVVMDKYSWMFDKKLINEVAADLAIYESAMSYKTMESLVEHVLETLKTHLADDNDRISTISEYQNKFVDIKNTLEGRVISKFVSEVLKKSKAGVVKTEKTHVGRDVINELLDDEFGEKEFDNVDVKKLQKIFDKKLEFGFDGDNAIGSIGKFLPDEKLKDMLYKESQDQETDDARPLIRYFLMDKYPKLADELEFEKSGDDKDEAPAPAPTAPAPAPTAPAPAPAEPTDDLTVEPAAEPTDDLGLDQTAQQPAASPTAQDQGSDEVGDLRKLAGL